MACKGKSKSSKKSKGTKKEQLNVNLSNPPF